MAKISFNDATMYGGNNGFDKRVDFFSLRNDNEEAVVRFMQDTVDSFELMTVHDVKVGGKDRKVSCLRTPMDPLEKCPLCQSGVPVRQRFFIHLIQYEKDSSGKIVGIPKIWERSATYAQKLKGYMDNFGPLSDIMCKIIRHGAPGNPNTTYEIIPNLNKDIYPDTTYAKNPDAFKDYSVLGGIVMDKDAASMEAYLQTGSFPQTNSNRQNNGGYNQNQNYSQNQNYNQNQTQAQPAYDPIGFPETYTPYTPPQNGPSDVPFTYGPDDSVPFTSTGTPVGNGTATGGFNSGEPKKWY